MLLAGLPIGYLLAWLARDELVAGKKGFLALAAVSLIAAVIISFTGFFLKFSVVLALFFIIIISLIAVWKSYDKRWVK
jgi:hypothetical protein